MQNPQQVCKNCEKLFDKDFRFCPHCGQQAREKLTVGVLFYNTISNYFSFDARFFKSFLPLMLKPGYLAKKFIEGKRLLYLHPAQLYLFVSVVFFFLMSTMVVRDNVQNIDKALKNAKIKPLIINDTLKAEAEKVIDSIKFDSVLKPIIDQRIPGLNDQHIQAIDSLIKNRAKEDSNAQLDFGYNTKIIDSLVAIEAPEDEIYKAMGMSEDASALTRKFYAQTLKFQKHRNGGQIFQAVYDTIPISLFILLPIFALILKLFYRKRGTYAHHLVFSFYYFSFLFTVFSLILIVDYFIDLPGALEFLIVLSTFIYLFIAIKKFYGRSWITSFIKTSVITFLYLSFVVPIALIILFIVGFLFY
ncbi:DUF3667 domain-containing protein [Seonamhaeicola marinus]|uniref:DUF3667 domain-containing protein n=1 Tax=Seonamhaeicola marinus TaxID=1912246 RepID=A0A5D0HKJ7_9FLAO|nr:DUF3667 domain-containing protein [Seonamhaeicola marinus]TYA71841.1 DUF3667 domain-containing protein [Seonamhaeicola marinus]